jgi:peptide/nickel transport system substrate-binding protein
MERGHAAARLAAALLLLAGGCTAQHASTASDAGVFSWTEAEDVDTLNPLMTTELAVTDLSVLTQGYCFLFDAHDELVPSLCLQVPTRENGGVSRDGKTITYRLRRGVHWQDGAPFTSADVAFTVKTILDPRFNDSNTFGYDDIASVDTPGPYAVVVHLKQPDSAFVSVFLNPAVGSGIIPKHLLDGQDVNRAAWNDLPVGLGPFRYTRWDRSNDIVMEANDRWWGGRPAIRKVIYRIIPDASTAINELRTGELDAFGRIPNELLPRARGIPQTRTIDFTTTAYEHVDFNLTNPILADVRVRRAIADAIDRPAIVQKVNHGSGYLTCSPIPHESWAYDAAAPCPAFDLTRAGQLLDEAGWRPGPDGVRRKGSRILQLVLASTVGNLSRDETAVLMQSWLRRIGIVLQYHRYPANELFAHAGGVLASGRYDLSLYSWAWGIDPDVSTLYSCAMRSPHGQNFTHYCNPRVDALLADAQRHYERVRRRADYVAVQEILARDLPSVVLYQAVHHLTAQGRFRGLSPGPALLFTRPAEISSGAFRNAGRSATAPQR